MLATRHRSDFDGTGIEMIDPGLWAAAERLSGDLRCSQAHPGHSSAHSKPMLSRQGFTLRVCVAPSGGRDQHYAQACGA